MGSSQERCEEAGANRAPRLDPRDLQSLRFVRAVVDDYGWQVGEQVISVQDADVHREDGS